MESGIVAGKGDHRAANNYPEGVEEHIPFKESCKISDGINEPGRQSTGEHADGKNEGIVQRPHEVLGINSADGKENSRCQAQVHALRRHGNPMEIAAGNKEKHTGYGQDDCQKLSPCRPFPSFQGDP